ncbi:hypothetical protein [Ralstonia sp. ASV6]|uniref:hypothetical protein n=1 Tax=Ralstonia sp. ASV6 TaxID=2795124 RepID=UPI0018EC9CC8|nr:hypothetical protein [Ralstonia sp. ASV6]
MCNGKALALAAMVGLSLAAPVMAADESATIGEVGRAQSGAILAKAQMREVQANQELKDAKNKSQGLPMGPTTVSQESLLPHVKMITNGEAGLHAVLVYADGSTSSGGEGATVSGGLKIKSISIAEKKVVVLDSAGKPRTLTFPLAAPPAPRMQAPSAAAPYATGGAFVQAPQSLPGAPAQPARY